eukprot:m.24230 g.24230  ORF g.24230 m.24230 type:complete len:509 (+) comp9642_c0_seq1:212-1738(+)
MAAPSALFPTAILLALLPALTLAANSTISSSTSTPANCLRVEISSSPCSVACGSGFRAVEYQVQEAPGCVSKIVQEVEPCTGSRCEDSATPTIVTRENDLILSVPTGNDVYIQYVDSVTNLPIGTAQRVITENVLEQTRQDLLTHMNTQLAALLAAIQIKANASDVATFRRETDASINDLQVQLNALNVDIGQRVPQSVFESALSAKADEASVVTRLEAKADASSVSSQLVLKADESSVASRFSSKADTAYVNTQLALKADASDVTSELQSKASITYVDNAINTRATTTALSNLGAQVNLKADAQAVSQALAAKADTGAVDQLRAIVDTKASTTTVNAKADKSYVDTELGKKQPRDTRLDIDSNGRMSYFGTGLYMTSFTRTITVGGAGGTWRTLLKGPQLPEGVYILSIPSFSTYSIGGQFYGESVATQPFAWYAGGTNDGNDQSFAELAIAHNGHAENSERIAIRVIRTGDGQLYGTGNPQESLLQIYSTHSWSSLTLNLRFLHLW